MAARFLLTAPRRPGGLVRFAQETLKTAATLQGQKSVWLTDVEAVIQASGETLQRNRQ
jgi:hypothetical protein